MSMNEERLRILLLGSGGREHALVWKLSQSPNVEQIYIVPGNGGTAGLHGVTNISNVNPNDFAGLVDFAKEKHVNLLVPGPETPLVDGIVDYFQEHAAGIDVFGPSKSAARMEGSKVFAKDFMKRHHIPTAEFKSFQEYEAAKSYIDSVAHDVVIKANGLAAGKGVIIPTSKEDAQNSLRNMMLNKEFGSAGDEVVIEEFLQGEELSVLSFCDGYTIRSLPLAQDHKRIFDGDQGPNTGGMGTYAPIDSASQSVMNAIEKEILRPTIDGMRQEWFPFKGCLFTGIMLTKTGPKVIEYNVRFGDPETQSVLPLLGTDLAEIMRACCKTCLDAVSLDILPIYAATVVVAAQGYPGSYPKGTEMKLDEVPEGVILFHAGTTAEHGTLKTSGGRVIAATGTGNSLVEAVKRAYQGVDAIHFAGMQFRKDIAARALQ